MVIKKATVGAARAARRCVAGLVFALTLTQCASAHAAIVRHGYFKLSDGTFLNYTLTLPSAEGRFPTVLQYDPYSAGATSDPTWNEDGYAMLGVNFRGTGCSSGTFNPLRGDIWGADGAQVVDWAAKQPWSDGSLGMIGYSFTGTSQLATAAYAGPALKAITPGNVFPDLYRDMIYPGGIHNGWIPLWILVRDYALGAQAAGQAIGDLHCAVDLVGHALPNIAQTLDTQLHPHLDGYWSKQPSTMLDRVHLPILGCVNWQDTTVYSRAFDSFRDALDPRTTWLVGANGQHTDCPTSRAQFVKFFDRYVKQQDNDWESTPHVQVVHETVGRVGSRPLTGYDGAWRTSFLQWSDMAQAIHPVSLHLQPGGRLDAAPAATGSASDSYTYPTVSPNSPADFLTISRWGNAPVTGGQLTYTTPVFAKDAEFLGDASADLWVASSATDTDLQVTISEIRPDGREMFVQNGWLRLSHRALDPSRSTALHPQHTDLQRDDRPLTPGQPVYARLHVIPFDHVFRAGSALRMTIDAPGGYFQLVPTPATNTIYHEPEHDSALVLGWVPRAGAHAAPGPCGKVLNQPCRPSSGSVADGSLAFPEPPAPAVVIGHASGLRNARRGHPFRLSLRGQGMTLRGVQVTLSDTRGRSIGRSRSFTLSTSRKRVRIAVTRAIRPGRYRLSASATAGDETKVSATRYIRVRRAGVSGRATIRRG